VHVFSVLLVTHQTSSLDYCKLTTHTGEEREGDGEGVKGEGREERYDMIYIYDKYDIFRFI